MRDIKVSYVPQNEAEAAILKYVVKSNGSLRASKPKCPKMTKIQDESDKGSILGYHYDYASEEDAVVGKAAYVWRMVVFSVSDVHQHQCMPVCAEFDLPHTFRYSEGSERRKTLDALADAIVNSIPKSEWYGVHRWGRALGYLAF